MKFSILSFVNLVLFSSHTLAGSLGDTFQIKNSNWSFAGRAIYLETNSNIYRNTTTLSVPNQLAKFGAGNPWGWGFQLEADYNYNTSTDININWYNLRSNTFKYKGTQSLNYSYPNGTRVHIIYQPSYASVQSIWDQVNLEYGKTIANNLNLKMLRLHAGLQYSRVGSNAMHNVPAIVSINGGAFNDDNDIVQSSSIFNGFGPRFGFDIIYSLLSKVDIYTKAGATLLSGYNKANFLGAGVIRINYNNLIVVPELDCKLGATISQNTKIGNFSADMGWIWVNYFGAMTTLINPAIQAVESSNIGLQGVYFGLKWIN